MNIVGNEIIRIDRRKVLKRAKGGLEAVEDKLFPLLFFEEGWMRDLRRNCEASLAAQTGWCPTRRAVERWATILSEVDHHPVRSAKEASQ
jgi:hypothetical protein